MVDLHPAGVAGADQHPVRTQQVPRPLQQHTTQTSFIPGPTRQHKRNLVLSLESAILLVKILLATSLTGRCNRDSGFPCKRTTFQRDGENCVFGYGAPKFRPISLLSQKVSIISTPKIVPLVEQVDLRTQLST